MKIKNLLTNEINQNGYNTNILTKNKIGFLYIAPIYIIPEDCLACDGYVLKIEDYKKLYEVIGETFNNGEELSDEFRIPDYNISGRFLQPGANAGIKIDAGLPNITGNINNLVTYDLNTAGAFNCSLGMGKNATYNGSPWEYSYISFNANNSSKVYGNSTTVQPPSQIIHVCIRYK